MIRCFYHLQDHVDSKDEFNIQNFLNLYGKKVFMYKKRKMLCELSDSSRLAAVSSFPTIYFLVVILHSGT